MTLDFPTHAAHLGSGTHRQSLQDSLSTLGGQTCEAALWLDARQLVKHRVTRQHLLTQIGYHLLAPPTPPGITQVVLDKFLGSLLADGFLNPAKYVSSSPP